MIRICIVPALILLIALAGSRSLRGQQDQPPGETPGSDSATVPGGQQEFTAQSLNEKMSYLFGYNFIQELKTLAVDPDLEQVIKGIQDAKAGIDPPMSDEEIIAVQQAFERALRRKQEEMRAAEADKNQREGAEFLRENALKDGVKELENGVQYMVLQEGTGTENPRLTDRVKVHYKVTFIDGTVFESSVGGPPATFAVSGVIRGFTSALQHMKTGDKWMVYIPGDQAYGSSEHSPVGPNRTLIFELELLEIVR